MNIAAKERLYAEIRRVLRPDGRVALHEIMAGPVQPVHFPVPWASDPSISFLQPPETIRALLKHTGFDEMAWSDVSQPALAWSRERAAASAAAGSATLPPLGLHLLLGPLFGTAFQNQVRNLEENRIVIVQAVCRRL